MLPHCVQDNTDFLNRIKKFNEETIDNLPIPADEIIHVSWDVVNMYPSIPKDLGMRKCRELT